MCTVYVLPASKSCSPQKGKMPEACLILTSLYMFVRKLSLVDQTKFGVSVIHEDETMEGKYIYHRKKKVL